MTEQTGSRHKDELNTKSLVATENIYNIKRLGRNIKMKLQQEIGLSLDINADNTRNIVAIRTNRNVVVHKNWVTTSI